MRLSVRLFAGLRERAGRDTIELDDLPEPLDVAGLRRVLVEREPALAPLDGVRGVLDERYVADTTPLVDGQEVSLLPPVSGGAPGLEDGIFELHAEPLDPGEAWRRVVHPSCGAVVLFTGTTRDTNRGKDVVQLDYEAFGTMAESEMATIFADCVAQLGDTDERALRMLVQHRTGTVGPGEPSVIVAVASPHRDAAFGAGRFLIDRLKEAVPIWKKEVYGDGHHWVGERS